MFTSQGFTGLYISYIYYKYKHKCLIYIYTHIYLITSLKSSLLSMLFFFFCNFDTCRPSVYKLTKFIHFLSLSCYPKSILNVHNFPLIMPGSPNILLIYFNDLKLFLFPPGRYNRHTLTYINNSKQTLTYTNVLKNIFPISINFLKSYFKRIHFNLIKILMQIYFFTLSVFANYYFFSASPYKYVGKVYGFMISVFKYFIAWSKSTKVTAILFHTTKCFLCNRWFIGFSSDHNSWL